MNWAPIRPKEKKPEHSPEVVAVLPALRKYLEGQVEVELRTVMETHGLKRHTAIAALKACWWRPDLKGGTHRNNVRVRLWRPASEAEIFADTIARAGKLRPAKVQFSLSTPACFASVMQFHAWREAAHEVLSANSALRDAGEEVPGDSGLSVCEDCRPSYQAAMIRENRCENPHVQFRWNVDDNDWEGYVG